MKCLWQRICCFDNGSLITSVRMASSLAIWNTNLCNEWKGCLILRWQQCIEDIFWELDSELRWLCSLHGGERQTVNGKSSNNAKLVVVMVLAIFNMWPNWFSFHSPPTFYTVWNYRICHEPWEVDSQLQFLAAGMTALHWKTLPKRVCGIVFFSHDFLNFFLKNYNSLFFICTQLELPWCSWVNLYTILVKFPIIIWSWHSG